MLASWPSALTVSKYGNGFQIPGVIAFWFTGVQDNAASFSQSGSVPATT